MSRVSLLYNRIYQIQNVVDFNEIKTILTFTITTFDIYFILGKLNLIKYTWYVTNTSRTLISTLSPSKLQ